MASGLLIFYMKITAFAPIVALLVIVVDSDLSLKIDSNEPIFESSSLGRIDVKMCYYRHAWIVTYL